MQNLKEFCSTTMDMECLSQLRMVKFGCLIRSYFECIFYLSHRWHPLSYSSFLLFSFSHIIFFIELYTVHPFANKWFGFLAEDTFYICVWLLCCWAHYQCLHSGSFPSVISIIYFVLHSNYLTCNSIYNSSKIILVLLPELRRGIAFYLLPVKLMRHFHKVLSFLLMYLLLASRRLLKWL